MTSSKRPKKQLRKASDDAVEKITKTTIEARAFLDQIELDIDEDDDDDERPMTQTGAPQYRLSFHVLIPEHLAQQFFQRFVKDGLVAVEFHPSVDPNMAGEWLVKP